MSHRDGATPRAVYDRMAATYDEMRGGGAGWLEQFDVTLAEGLGAATRFLDVGCGTGRFLVEAVRRLGLRGWGVDQSDEMLARARDRARDESRVGFKQATADQLPFRDDWFDAVAMRLVVHALGPARPAALRELERVLAPGGHAFIWTFAPEHFTGYYLGPYLPSLPALDLARFPAPDALSDELRAAGFTDVRVRELDQTDAIERRVAAQRVRDGFISSVHLLDPVEVERAVGLLEAEAEAGEPPLVRVQRWRLLVATR